MNEGKQKPKPGRQYFPSPMLSFVALGLFFGIAGGLINGILDVYDSAIFPYGMSRLAVETAARSMKVGLTWGLVWACIFGFYGWLTKRLTGSPRRAVLAHLFAAFFWVLLVLGIVASLLQSLDKKLPLPYQQEVTPTIFLSRFIWPLLAYAITLKPLVVLVLLAASLSVPMALGVLIVFLLRRRIGQHPFSRVPSLAMTRTGAVIGAVVLALTLLTINLPGFLPSPTGKPNVLLVSVDTLRADGLGCYGNPRPTSPVIDRLAQNGTRYANYFTSAPWTLPAHVSMLTGIEPDVHGVYTLSRSIPREAPLLAEIFKNAGYHTFSMTSNFLVSPTYGFGRGFDKSMFRAEAEAGFVEKISLQLLGKTQEPWFGFIHFFDTHLPYRPTAQSSKELGIQGREMDEVLASMTHLLFRFVDIYLPYDETHKAMVRWLYDAEVRDVDRALGRILTQINTQFGLKNTYVILTSDHGEEFFEHGWVGHSVSLFDETAHVPLIVAGPNIEAGKVVEETVGMSELAPLILSYAGLPDPLKRGAPQVGRGAYSHTNAFGIHRFSWRRDGWSFLTPNEFSYGSRKITYPLGLYHERKEQANLIAADPEQAAKMKDEMDRHIGAQVKAFGRMIPKETTLDKARLQRLRELGYVQ